MVGLTRFRAKLCQQFDHLAEMSRTASRQKPLLPATQVLMLTVHDDNDSLFDSILAGADGYLLKDTVPSQLVAAIREVHGGGSPMTPEIARRVVQHFRKSAAVRTEVEGLTPRELEVLELLARGAQVSERPA